MSIATDFQDLRREIAVMYGSEDRETAKVRGAHLSTVARQTPFTLTANVGSAALVMWTFHDQVPAGLWFWLAVMAALMLLTARTWWRNRNRTLETASRKAMHRATLHALTLAVVWAFVPLVWFPQATTPQQLIIATLFTGMLGAGAFILSPLPLASLAYTGVYCASSLGALWLADTPIYVAVMALLCFYGPIVMVGSLFAWQKATALLHSRADARRQENFVSVLLQDFEQHAGEALWETSAEGHLNHLSPRLAELLGIDAASFQEKPFLGLIESGGAAAAATLREAMNAGHPFREVQVTLRIGSADRHLSVNGKRLLDDHGRTLGWRGVLADVTAKVESERQLRELAHTDSLTGLSNRFMLRDAIGAAQRRGGSGALLAIDLDHFKGVNDNFGHSTGDELLKAVAQRLRACVRPGDLIARLGGDEFAILMNHTGDAADAGTLARRLVETLVQPFNFGERQLNIGASVGVARFEAGATDIDNLLIHADTALYAAKEGGRGRWEAYSPQMGERSRRRAAIEEGLGHAIERGHLALHLQPKVNIRNWEITGAEALMRWQDPVLGRVNPVEFIAIAEQCGRIDELGHWALREACRMAGGPLRNLTLSVNVSPAQLRSGRFVGHVRDALREFDVIPACLELEITESVFMGDVDDALAQLHALRGLGIRIALDDFGTGYSSLAYLRRFPFDTLKIDRAFVSEILLRKDARAIVQMITQLATTLGMRTVSEGVETTQQLAAIALAGCDEMQGYLVAAPIPITEFLRLCRGWQAKLPNLAATSA